MTTALRFRDHGEFHRAALHMAVAGGLAGLTLHVAGLLVAGLGGLTAPLPVAALAAAMAFAAASPKTRLRTDELAALALGGGGAALALSVASALGAARPIEALAFAAVFAALLSRGLAGRRRAATLAIAGAAGLAALHVLSAIAGASDAPFWLTAAAGGTAFGVVAALGVLPRHLELRHDPVAEAWASCQPHVGGEHRELAERGLAVWRWGCEALEPDSPLRAPTRDAVLQLLQVAERWGAAEASGRLAVDPEALSRRTETLDDKLASVRDPEAREQYERAREALAEQRRYAEEIATLRERALARMHRYVASLERFRLAADSHRSADTLRLAEGDARPMLEELEALGGDIDCASEALREAEKLAEPAASREAGG